MRGHSVKSQHWCPKFTQTQLRRSLSRLEIRAMTMLHKNPNAVHHLTSSMIRKNHRGNWGESWKSTEWIYQGYLFFSSVGWRTYETYDTEVRAVVEQQYLPNVLVPVEHMANFHRSVAEPGRNGLRFLISGYVQAKFARWRKWRKWIAAAELSEKRCMTEFCSIMVNKLKPAGESAREDSKDFRNFALHNCILNFDTKQVH